MQGAESTLIRLTICCQEACDFYTQAAQSAGDPDLARIFYKMASVRHKVIQAFSEKVISQPPENDQFPDYTPESIRLFDEMKSFLESGRLDEDFLLHLERAEDRFLDEFKKSLSEKLPYETKFMVLTYLINLYNMNEELKNIRAKIHNLDPFL